MIAPLLQACSHFASLAEKQRDPDYRLCGARSGQPCVWARRADGVVDPPFHSERWEAALTVANNDPAHTMAKAKLDQAILNSGEV